MNYPGIGADEVVYAVGDIHGRADLLEAMFERIEADRARRPEANATEIYLGDFIDRGPDSAGVLRRLMRRGGERALVCLTGNHEQMMLDAAGDENAFEHWLDNGGEATLDSFSAPRSLFGGYCRTALAALPEAELGFVQGLQLIHRHGPYLFVHAGVRPGVAEGAQNAHDLLWIREGFLDHPDPLPGTVVVHGHTPVDRPEFRLGRIGLDTGAVFSGRLTCLRIDAEGAAIL